ncbi:MAG TPA: C1 family peptidase [Chitinophagales bacterium]|nr:C1 family peptidase [Chitinophagales bacterium]
MRKISLLILLSLAFVNLFSQNVVTKVIGKIKKADGTFVRIGTKISEKEVLQFSSKQDVIRMIVPGKGTFIVSPSAAAQKKDNLWIEVLSKTIRVQSSTASLSARSEMYEKIPNAFETNTNVNSLILISNSQPNKYLFNTNDYDLSNGSWLGLQINQKGNKSVMHILRTSKDTLLLYRSDFQSDEVNGKETTYQLAFYDKTKNKATAKAVIKPYFDDAGEMEAIIYTLIKDNKTKPKTTQKELCYNEVYKALGKPSDLLFYATFDKIMQQINKPIVTNNNYKKGLKEDIESYQKVKKLLSNNMRGADDLPAQFSLRQYTPVVRSQGNYGTCVAWSTAYAARTIAWSVRNNYNNIDSAAAIAKHSFSPQFLFLNIKFQDDNTCQNGSSLVTALQFMEDKGVIAWDNSPYNCATVYSDADRKNAENYKIHDFQRFSSWFDIQDSTILDMKRMLKEKKPIVFSMYLPKSFNTVDTKTGIWYPNPKDYVEVRNAKKISDLYVGHAMCIIGYNDAVNGGSFEIMNSWGTDAGKDGFYWISYDDLKKFGSQVLFIEDN